MENDVDGVHVLFRYSEVATSVQDSILLPHWKWHGGCWRLPSDSLQCESGEENPTLHSQ